MIFRRTKGGTLSFLIHSLALWQTIFCSCNCPNVNPCLNGGLCKADCGPEGYICICSWGFTGNTCQIATTMTNCPGQFQCSDGTCISTSQRCDYFADCSGRDDEIGCACALGDFTCGDGSCLSASRLCDGFRDCPNNDDEISCSTTPAAIGCSDPGPLANGYQTGSFLDGGTLQFSCNSGYTLVGAAVVVCISGVWSTTIPTCHQNCLPATPPADGVAAGSSNHGDVVTYSCNVGYSLIGNQFTVCQDGIWIGSIPTCHADCTMPMSPPDGVVTGTSLHGDIIIFSCLGGHTLVGSEMSRCSDGSWSNSAASCHADCADPGTPTNGQRFGSLTHGNTMSYVCNSGFTMIGNGVSSCSDGVWSHPLPECFADCEDPGTPDYGSTMGDMHHGETLSYSCDANYVLYGVNVITCTEGIWNGTAPSCFDLTPTYHWELSGKLSAAEPDPADCLGNAKSTVYELMQGRDGYIAIMTTPIPLLDVPLLSAPPQKRSVHSCAIYYNTSNYIYLQDFDGECLADVSLCTDGITVAFWMNIDMALNLNITYHFTSGGQSLKGRGFAIWSVNHATDYLVWAAQVRKDKAKMFRRMYAISGFPQNTWFHFVGTFKALDRGNVYIDGLQQTVTTETSEYVREDQSTTSTGLFIGGSNSAPFNATVRGEAGMSDLQVFYRELSAEEVSALYENESGS
ncbi:CUB and sushi domain-containing protein 1-like [Ptychodera flava]|uniref:CUB and sushi domain-containing protein 1-like n=1 Tax=Ptychodera flava TaxID=63121 RepID=UPI00396AA225